MTNFTESIIEQAALDWLQSLGYTYAFGPDLAFDGSAPERKNYEDVILLERLQEALARPRDTLLSKWMRGEVRVNDVIPFGL